VRIPPYDDCRHDRRNDTPNGDVVTATVPKATGLVVPLRELTRADGAAAGVKAATLGELAHAGIAVPEGLVLSAPATRAALGDLGPEATPEQVLGAALPANVEAHLADIAAHFGDATLAVRSSASAEDLPDASYAGLYDSVLGVRGLPALREAVRRCWASAYGGRVRAYAGGGRGEPPTIAVLVQRQIDADVAGVAFSANPVTGELDEVLVSAALGLGDALVSGAEQPDEWVVRGSSATAERVVHQALTAEQARTVAGLALRVQGLLSGPVDVEWAMAGGRLLLVQARPITALPRPPVADFGPGTWFKDIEHYPEPFTAFGASLAAPWVAEGLSSMLATWGGLLDRMETRCVGGEAYVRPVPTGGHDGAPPPWWALGLLARLTPPLRRRMRTARRMIRPEVFAEQARLWETVWQPELESAAERLGSADLSGLDDAALDAHLGDVVDTAHRALGHHFHLVPLYTVPAHELVQRCRELLGWDEPEALGLLTGTSVKSSEPTRALAELAGQISRRPGARAAVETAGDDVAGRIADADPELAAAYADWCRRYAVRCVNDDPGSPALTERPWLLTSLLRDAVHAHADVEPGLAERTEAARTGAVERARAILARRSAPDRDRFEAALTTALRYYPLREDTTFRLARIAGAGRLALLEAGRRLATRGELDRPDDAAQLDAAVLRMALTGSAAGDLRARVAQAKAERAWVSQHPGPAVVGPPPGRLPDIRGLPEAGRRLNAALLWAQPRPPAPRAHPEAVVNGAPGSPGSYTGPVRIVRGEADFAVLRPGEILVAPTTDPAWSVLFGIAGALVTDGGGILSHAAILAREHAVPAVVGTGAATSTLSDGEIVTVDGSTGRVLRESKEGP
jgi:pyruvate,water dikinase